MSQFIAYNDQVEVKRESLIFIVKAFDRGSDFRAEILIKHGALINNPDLEWFNIQNSLNAFKEISQKIGDMSMFMIGKAVVSRSEFPPIANLKEALSSLDIAYHMNHRLNGKLMFDPATGQKTAGIGSYHLQEFDEGQKAAVLVCDNPYPSKLDEGIITQLVRKFKPIGAREEVKLDTNKPTRLAGADSCTFLINWH